MNRIKELLAMLNIKIPMKKGKNGMLIGVIKAMSINLNYIDFFMYGKDRI
jgi:hypothetical protein